jgi:hypothetical protein
MAISREALREWHRMFGLLLADLFSGSPFSVEVECDLSVQQQLLDVAIVRRGRGRAMVGGMAVKDQVVVHQGVASPPTFTAKWRVAAKDRLGMRREPSGTSQEG